MSGDPSNPNASAEREGGGFFRRRVALQSAKESLQPEAAPPPPPPRKRPRRRSTLSALSGFVTFVVVAATGVVGAGLYARQEMRAPGPLQADKIVLIAQRTETPEIVAQLEREGVVESGMLLNAALLVTGDRKRLKAGEYLFKAHASPRDVIDTMISGHEILHSITIPEGLTSEQIVAKLNESDVLSGEIREIPKEGSLLPETYRIARGMQRNDLIRKMQDDQKKALEQIWSQRSPDLPLRSSFDLLILASIVEKETGKADERPRVAGVFINRLRNHTKLQSDPTIVYGIVQGKGTLGRPILRSEVDKPTPYNTYAIEGLPPGPISNPGRAALEAVANPSRTKDVYFVADGTGGHAFAETLDQHNKNVARWRQIEKDRASAGAASPSAGIDQAPVVQPTTAPATPPAPAAGRRGDIDGPSVPLFGALSTAFARQVPPTPAPVVGAPQAVAAAAGGNPRPSGLPVKASAYAIAGKIDDTIAAQFGMRDEPSPAEEDPAVTDPGAYAESPARRADQLARAAKYGLGDTANDGNPLAAEAQEAAPPAQASGPRIVRIYDASEGTALDPLKDKSWDLNTPKTVPVLSPLPSAAPAPRKAETRTAKAPARKSVAQ